MSDVKVKPNMECSVTLEMARRCNGVIANEATKRPPLRRLRHLTNDRWIDSLLSQLG